MVSKHVCGYEQKLTRIYDYGYTYDKRGNLVKEEEICSPTTTGPRNITIATYLYDETNRMVQGTNKAGEVSAYTFNGLGVRVGTELILKDNTHGYTDFHCQTPSVETGIEKPEVVKTDYVIDYTRLDIDQRVLMKSEQDGYDFFYTYGLDKLQVMTIGEGSNWWGQSIKKCVNMAYVHTDRLGSVVNLSDQYGRVTARADYTDWGEVRRYTDITVDGGFRRLLPEITYATHEYDDVLNQFYAKARMYDAENKRFDAVDPILDASKGNIKELLKKPALLTQYTYALDAPFTHIDPTGKVVTPANVVGGIAGLVGGYLIGNVIADYFELPQCTRKLVAGSVSGLLAVAGWFAGPAIYAALKPVVTQLIVTGQLVISKGQEWILKTIGVGQRYINQALRLIDMNSIRFSQTVQKHLATDRKMPVSTIIDAIKTGTPAADPKGTAHIMYYSTIWVNGKQYTMEVLVDWATKTVLHYLYK